MNRETKVAQKARDARRMKTQSAKGLLWQKQHPEACRNRMRELRAKYGRSDGIHAKMIEEARNPIAFDSDACIVAGDWHIPFYHTGMFNYLLDVAQTYGVHDLAIPGDFWDCDNYSTFLHLTPAACFKSEIEEVAKVLDVLVERFDRIYISRGNHENRWINLNQGMVGMDELFALTKINDGYEVTTDDHMVMNPGSDNAWLFAHPRNFRQTPLSVARDLAAKYGMNTVSAHGHFFGQGFDRSGRKYCLDGGGIFNPAELDYLRQTNCTPWVSNGFYLIMPDSYEAFNLGNEFQVSKEFYRKYVKDARKRLKDARCK